MGQNFAVVGVAGYIAPRHLKAIQETGNRLAAAMDPNDSVGILDRYSYEVRYFREIERFDRHLYKLHRSSEVDRIHWVSVCSPNYLHDAHIRMALRNGANALCEKPLVISPWNLDALEALENETGRQVFTVLQLRTHPQLIAVRKKLFATNSPRRRRVDLTYVTSRGPWYHVSWKGSEEKSGGLATNIGIHLFDLLIWLFGAPQKSGITVNEATRIGGELELERADVHWFLSVNPADLPVKLQSRDRTTLRSITIDGEEVEFSDGFGDLHTEVYRRTLAGEGFGIADARPSVELVHGLRAFADKN